MIRRKFLTVVGAAVTTGLLGAARTQGALRSGVPDVFFEVGSVQIFEDHDTRGDPSYSPVREPRVLPKGMRPHRQQRRGGL
jgi:hypothetical protein